MAFPPYQYAEQEIERFSAASDKLIRDEHWSNIEALRCAARDAYNLGYQHRRSRALNEAYSAFKDVWRQFPNSPLARSPLADA